jgi:RNA polymerase sigma-70 factor (ECF subfamily)
LLHSELVAKVDEAISDLPENQRTAILLCRREEFSYEEIAAVLGVSVSATKSLIHRARETLKGRLKPYLHSGDWKDAPSDSAKRDPKLCAACGVQTSEPS